MENQLFYELVDRYLEGTATSEEKLLVESYYEQLASEGPELPAEKILQLKEEIYKKVEMNIRPQARIITLQRKWWRMAGAAAVVLLLAGAAWFAWLRDANPQPVNGGQYAAGNEINPANGGTTLILENGAQLSVDSLANGKLAITGITGITKTDGQLLYKTASEISFNTLKTGKGKSYRVALADGTQVWLDALSSIRFPTAFPGNDRVVEITGQVYFEVAHNAKQPFIVKAGDKMIEVLGTHFNVNTFDQVMKTTLLEGSVKISMKEQAVVIKPGEQAEIDSGSPFTVHQSPDLDEVMAWKNGRFRFTGNSVEEIFKQLSRWYDIEVQYQDAINEKFVANISRDVPLSKVLALFEMTKQVKFNIEGKKITVMK